MLICELHELGRPSMEELPLVLLKLFQEINRLLIILVEFQQLFGVYIQVIFYVKLRHFFKDHQCERLVFVILWWCLNLLNLFSHNIFEENLLKGVFFILFQNLRN
jgi:hypothetical protein